MSSNNTNFTTAAVVWETVGQNQSTFIQWYGVIIPVVCAIGVLGNCLNLCLIARKRRKGHADAVRRSASNTMMAMATSDLLFCLAILPQTIFATKGYCVEINERYAIYYRIYGIALINLFLMTGTALITVTAYMRYIAVTSPLSARNSKTLRNSHVTVAVVCSACLALTMPQFFYLDVTQMDISSSISIYCIVFRFEYKLHLWTQRYVIKLYEAHILLSPVSLMYFNIIISSRPLFF